jgi:hypothetical protein
MSRRRDQHLQRTHCQHAPVHARDPVDLEPTRALVEEVLRTALALEDVIVSLLDDLPPGAFPDEDPGLVLLEMVVGSVHPAVVAAGADECRTATALVGAVRERVIEDLRTAATLAGERERTEREGTTDANGS